MHDQRPLSPNQSPTPSPIPPAIALMAGVAARLATLKGEVTDWWLQTQDAPPNIDPNATVPVSLLDLLAMLPDLPPLTTVLGWEEGARPLLLPLTKGEIPHLLIGGAARAGKTTLLQSILFSLAYLNRQAQLQLVVVEAGQRPINLQGLGSLPHLLTPVLTTTKEITDLLAFLEEEKAYRHAQKATTPAIVVAIDDLGTLLTTAGPPLLAAFSRLLTDAADAGIYIIATVDEDNLAWQALTPHFAVRLVGRVSSPQMATAVSGIPYLQASALLGGGDFLAIVAGAVYHFQAAALTPYELSLCVQQVTRWARPVLLAQSRRPAPLPTVTESTNLGSGIYFVDEQGTVPLAAAPTNQPQPAPTTTGPERRRHKELPDVTYYEL